MSGGSPCARGVLWVSLSVAGVASRSREGVTAHDGCRLLFCGGGGSVGLPPLLRLSVSYILAAVRQPGAMPGYSPPHLRSDTDLERCRTCIDKHLALRAGFEVHLLALRAGFEEIADGLHLCHHPRAPANKVLDVTGSFLMHQMIVKCSKPC